MDKHATKPVEGWDKTFVAWLKTMVSKPPTQKEKDQMARAIEFDLDHQRVFRGETIEQRMATFKSLGYLYEGMEVTINGVKTRF